LYLQREALFLYGEDSELATRFMRIAEFLISGHPKRHALLANLTPFICTVTAKVEPFQALNERFLKGYNSAQIVGDIDGAMASGLSYCIANIYCFPDDLLSVQGKVMYFFHRSVSITCIRFVPPNTAHLSHTVFANLIKVERRRQPVLHSLMCLTNICTALMGSAIETGEDMKCNEELLQIAEKTKSGVLVHHVVIGQMYIDCYFRNYLSAVNFSENYRTMRRNIGVRRVLDVFYLFFEGICKWKRFACSVEISVQCLRLPLDSL